LADLYAIDQLRVMEFAQRAWNDVSDSTISNCFRHAGILSCRGENGAPVGVDSHPRSTALVDPELNFALSRLEDNNEALIRLGVIEPSCKMTLDFLCGPPNEHELGIVEFTDAEIVAEIKSRREGVAEVEEEEAPSVRVVSIEEALEAAT
jgi:hypothetical protein